MKRLILIAAVTLSACSASTESPRQTVVVQTRGGLEPITNDLGWTIEISRAVVRIRDMQFTTLGEAHASVFPNWLVPQAFAHPGHLAGGEVVGELTGDLEVDFAADAIELGTARLIEAKYEGVNFIFWNEDGVSLELEGVAENAETSVSWTADVHQDDERTVTGIAFSRTVESATDPIVFAFEPADPSSDETIFDGVDFNDADLFVGESASANRLVRATQKHNFWSAE